MKGFHSSRRKCLIKLRHSRRKSIRRRSSLTWQPNCRGRAPYAAELRTRYDATPYNQGQVQHTKLGTVHVEAMKDELEARGIEYAPNKGIRKLTKALTTKLCNDWVAAAARIQAWIQKSMTMTAVRLGFSSQ